MLKIMARENLEEWSEITRTLSDMAGGAMWCPGDAIALRQDGATGASVLAGARGDALYLWDA